MAVATLYFACWIAALLLLKHVILAEFEVSPYGWSAAYFAGFLCIKT